MREGSDNSLSDKEKLDRLRLIRSQYVGPVTFHQLLSRFGTAAAALAALPDLARRGGRRSSPRLCSISQAEREFAAHEALGARLIFYGEPSYPPRLTVTVDAPPVLSAVGHLELLTKKAVGVVGARNASANGCRFARQIAAELGGSGYLIVSGMARGIDAAAHWGALGTGTVAVLGCGIDITYPKQNLDLFAALHETGALISELPPGTRPAARHFPRRNRIISGMARGIVVVEATPRSGSLITARLAADQGREVFAVPGAAQDARGHGTNGLIRDGAVLTESAADVLAVLDNMPQSIATRGRQPISAVALPETRNNENLGTDDNADTSAKDGIDARGPTKDPTPAVHYAIIAALGPSPTPLDDLIRASGATSSEVATVLLELELAGRVERHPGGRVSLLMET